MTGPENWGSFNTRDCLIEMTSLIVFR